MRAAKTMTSGFFRMPAKDFWKKRKSDAGTSKTEWNRTKEGCSWKVAVIFGALFFAGYVGGIWTGRSGGSEFGETLASYYMDAENFSAFAPLFLDLFSSAILQTTMVLLCGFSAAGSLFLALYFVARGAVLGVCVAGVFIRGGTRALVIHWLVTCLPDLGIFLVMLWLAVQANACAAGLLQGLLGTSTRRNPSLPARRMIIRFLMALFLCAGCCVLGAASGVLFAGALL